MIFTLMHSVLCALLNLLVLFVFVAQLGGMGMYFNDSQPNGASYLPNLM